MCRAQRNKTQAQRDGAQSPPTTKFGPVKKRSRKPAQKKKKKSTRKDIFLANLIRSEFAALEAAPPAAVLGDLSNPILPIFRPANFPDVENYHAIAPSARLASLLLQHASVRPMPRLILTHGPLIPLGEADEKDPDSPKELFAYPANPKPVTRRDVKLIDDTLAELAEFITFRADDDKPLGTATTTPIPRKRPRKMRPRFLPGICSTTTYSTAMQDILTNAATAQSPRKKRLPTPDIPLLFAYRFSFAVELAHEVCHALSFARDGHTRDFATDPFFPDTQVAELGSAIEENLFGGHFTMLWDEPNSPTTLQAQQSKTAAAAAPDPFRLHFKSPRTSSDLLGIPVMWSWPCKWMARNYKHHRCGMWLRQADWAALPSKDIVWRVPVGDLARFFSMDFWAQQEPDVALERKVGFAFACNQKREKRPAHLSVRDRRLVLPDGFRVSGDQAIVGGEDEVIEVQ